ncbi:MAG: hypothetical protein IPK83_07355 [Planctomycetes bacterium]|nr:hypothetical protein [Planctomycetota bacterium]
MKPLQFYFVGLTAITLALTGAHVPAAEPKAAPASQPTTQPIERPGVNTIQKEANALMPLIQGGFTRKFLAATADLPRIEERKAYVDPATRKYYSQKSYDKLDPSEREALQPIAFSEGIYYMTKYGSPLAYSRVLETLDKHKVAIGPGWRVLDYGYGTVGHLRLLAINGLDVVGVDVDPFLGELYSEASDQGVVSGRGGRDGHIKLVDGRWPGDASVKKAVGGKYDLIVSKNTLKNGYIHPARPVDKRMLVDLGVSDEAFVTALSQSLKVGGHVIIYNICPAPAAEDQPYIPWADGRCPFPREMWEKAGFEVVAFDEDDGAAVRAMGQALGWDAGQSRKEFDESLFAHYSIFRRT